MGRQRSRPLVNFLGLLEIILFLGTDASPQLAVRNNFDSSDNTFSQGSDECQTIIFATVQKQFHKIPTNVPAVIFSLNGNQPEATENFLRRELSLDHLRHPLRFESFHFIRQCSAVNVYGSESTDFLRVIRYVVTEKLAQSNRDYFLLHGKTSVLQELALSDAYHYISQIGTVCMDTQPADSGSGDTHSTFKASSEPFEQRHEHGREKILNVLAVSGAQFYRFETEHSAPGGIFYYMIMECKTKLNMSMQIKSTSSSGSKINGTWGGVVGAFLDGSADLAFPIGITEDRQPAMDYSNTLEIYSKVFWVKGAARKSMPNAIFRPFASDVWIALLVVLVTATPVLFQFIRKDYSGKEYSVSHDNKMILNKSVDIVIRLLLEQSTALRNLSGGRTRCMIFMWAMLSSIIVTGYRSKLYYFLTFTEGDPIPRSFRELAFSDYKLHFRTYGGPGLKDLLESKDPIDRALTANDRLLLEKSTEGCIKRVVTEERAACLDFDFSGEYAIAANATLFAEAELSAELQLFKRSVDWIGQYMICWAFPEGSPHVRAFNGLITWMQASGLYGHWVKKDWGNQKIISRRYLRSLNDSVVRNSLEQLEQELSSGPKPLPLTTLALPLLFVYFGGLIAAIAFSLEAILIKYKIARPWNALRRFRCSQNCKIF